MKDIKFPTTAYLELTIPETNIPTCAILDTGAK